MANDIDMLNDIVELENRREISQAYALGELYAYRYIGERDVFKNDEEFEIAKSHYIKLYGALDNYV